LTDNERQSRERDALTELLESIVRHRLELDSLEVEWDIISRKIGQEHENNNSYQFQDDHHAWIKGLTE
jgi:hypothetical protein